MLWFKKRKSVDGGHGEAHHAEARAIEDKHKVEAKWLDVADVVARLDRHRAQNGFGQDIKAAMRRRRA